MRDPLYEEAKRAIEEVHTLRTRLAAVEAERDSLRITIEECQVVLDRQRRDVREALDRAQVAEAERDAARKDARQAVHVVRSGIVAYVRQKATHSVVNGRLLLNLADDLEDFEHPTFVDQLVTERDHWKARAEAAEQRLDFAIGQAANTIKENTRRATAEEIAAWLDVMAEGVVYDSLSNMAEQIRAVWCGKEGK